MNDPWSFFDGDFFNEEGFIEGNPCTKKLGCNRIFRGITCLLFKGLSRVSECVMDSLKYSPASLGFSSQDSEGSWSLRSIRESHRVGLESQGTTIPSEGRTKESSVSNKS